MRESRTSTATIGTTVEVIIAPSPRRFAITFFPSSGNRYTLKTVDDSFAIDEGPTILEGGGAVELTFERHGEIVQRAWYAIGSAAGTKIGFIETFEL